MKIPCKDCLVYPACRQKIEINCDKLHDWVWKDGNIYIELPNVLYVGCDNGTSTFLLAEESGDT